MSSNPLKNVSALVFDIIGTLADWHTPLVRALQAHAVQHESLEKRKIDWNAFANEWNEEADMLINGQEAKPIDGLYRHALEVMLKKYEIAEWDDAEKADLVKTWAMMEAFPDTASGLQALRRKYALVGLSNASSRALIESNKRDDMIFDLLLTGNIVGHYKPHPSMYLAAQAAVGYEAHEVAMVAAHAGDLDGAARQGLRTIYIKRAEEKNPGSLDRFDLVVEEGGIPELARRLESL